MVRFLFIVFLSFLLAVPSAEAQSRRDSLSMLHSPSKATLLSAALPGAGQFYNKKYWKIPVIYAGFAGLGYLVKTNHDDYKIYKDAYRLRLDMDENTVDDFVGVYSDEDLVTLKNYYRRNRDLSMIGIGLLYILNIIDASVDAHLFYFNVSDDLTLHVQPGYSGGYFAGPALNLSVNF
ncbi:MAG TPA: DUF5683 domain-containing protein [Bacteroidia bacterium]|nr:DUF5683 domain-containing protein [Bacteroidia bacterium]